MRQRVLFPPFPCTLMFVGFVPVRMVHSRAPLGPAGSFGGVGSIPVPQGSRRIISCAFGPFPYALMAVGFVRVRNGGR